MRYIGSLGDDKQLETLIAYLVTQKIQVHVDREAGQRNLWIKNEDHVEAAQQHLQQFLANPTDVQYANVLERASEMLRAEARQRTESRKLIKNYASQMRLGPTYRAPLTTALIVLCVVLWAIQWFAPPRASMFGGSSERISENAAEPTSGNRIERMLNSKLYRALAFAAIPPSASQELRGREKDDLRVRAYNILRGEVWRLVTPVFIHFGPWHLALNLISLFQLGRVLETRYGTIRLLLVMLAIAIISNFLQGVVPVRWDGSPVGVLKDGWGVSFFGGISGVVFGLLGFAWIKSRYDWKSGFYIPRATMIWAIAWIFLGISPLDRQLLGADMANWAHGAGFLVGIALAYLSVYHNSALKTKS